jgi:acetyl esterase/lipase
MPALPVPSQVPPPIAAGLLRIGRDIDPPATAPLYAPLQQREPYAGVTVLRDQRYDADARHLLDVFTPQQAAAQSAPVLVFIHGGGFTGGGRRSGASPFYDNILVWAAQHGMVGVNMTYRLAPDHAWPAAQHDVAAAMAWVRKNIAASGGDPRRIVAMGHSAGAAHLANYLAHPEFHVAPGGGIAGAILVSGMYDTPTAEVSESMQAYFGDDASLYPRRSALPSLGVCDVPLLFIDAELDPPEFHQQSDAAEAALRAAGRACELLRLQGHSHMSEVYAIGTADTALSDAIAAFVAAR